MRPSSTEPTPRPGPVATGPTDDLIRTAGQQDGVRPVNFDRPLSGHELGWADPVVAQRIAEERRAARAQAHSLGYAAGWAEGRRAAARAEQDERAERERRNAEALAEQSRDAVRLLRGLADAVRTADRTAAPAWEQVSDILADGVLTLARAVLDRELDAVDHPTAAAVRAALHGLGDVGEVAVHVHPGELDLLTRLVGDALPDKVRLVGDPEVAAGAAVAAGPAQRLRYDLPAALARAEEVLRR
jgi:flagellar assembly protein FliH